MVRHSRNDPRSASFILILFECARKLFLGRGRLGDFIKPVIGLVVMRDLRQPGRYLVRMKGLARKERKTR
jgi:hypothetical protein